MYLLDTNIVSLLNPRRQPLVLPLIGWLRRNGAHIALSAITLTELESGIFKLRREAKIQRAAEYESLRDAIVTEFDDRILGLDSAVALKIAHLAERARPAVIELADLIIMATAEVHGLTVLTRNLRHFAPTGVKALDPLAQLPPEIAG